MVTRVQGRGIRRYWDAKCFIALLNDEADAQVCERILEQAKERQTQICVSPIVQVEVIRPRGSATPLAKELRDKVRAFFENDYIRWRIVDRKIANDAQQLCWDYPLHPRDAIHLAVALDLGCDLLETSDSDLLRLDQTIPSTSLRICKPGALGQADLFDLH